LVNESDNRPVETETADRPVLGALRQVSEAVNLPLRPLYDAFRLHDDDARVIYPLLIATAAWALAGGGLAALVGWEVRSAMRRRQALSLTLAATFLVVAWALLYRLTPDPWQIGGLGRLSSAAGYAAFAAAVAAGLFAVPRRVRLWTSVPVVLLLGVLIVAWPTWDVSAFPHSVSAQELAHGFVTDDPAGAPELVLYTTAGEFKVASADDATLVPDDARVIGFRGFRLSLRQRLAALGQGWTLRPVFRFSSLPAPTSSRTGR